MKKCADIVFRRGKMVKGYCLHVLEEQVEALDTANNDCYKFLGCICEQSDKILTKKVLTGVKKEMSGRLRNLVELKLYDKHLIKAKKIRVVRVAAYNMNACNMMKK